MRLSDTAIIREMDLGNIVIGYNETLTPGKEVSGVTADLTLGNEFIEVVPAIDNQVIDPMTSDLSITYGKSTTYTHGDGHVLKPGELVLANTTETVELKSGTLLGWLDGKSKLARMGIMVHLTAHRIDPGWSGNIVLEIYNASPNNILLKVGMPIAAISFERIEGKVEYPYLERLDASYKRQSTVLTPSNKI